MANLSTTSPWIEAGKGIQSAIGNVGAIQGIMRQKNLMEREEQEAPLRMQNIQRQGKLQDIQLQEAEIGNKPVYVDETLGKMFSDRPMTKQLYGEAALPFMETDPEGRKFVRNRNVPKVFEQINSVPFAKRAAIATLADIDLQIQALQPKKDAAGQEIPEAPDMKVQREFAIKKLNEQKNSINKLYGLMEGGDLQEMVDEKGVSHWYDKKNQKMVPELDGLKGTRATTGRSEFQTWMGGTPEEKKAVEDFMALKKSGEKLTVKGFDKAGKSVYASPTGTLVYEDGTPYKGGQLKGVTEPWAPVPPEWEKKEQLNTVRTDMKSVRDELKDLRAFPDIDFYKDKKARIPILEKRFAELQNEEKRLTGGGPVSGAVREVKKPASSGASDYIKRSLGGH